MPDQPIRTLLIDDEPLATLELTEMLKPFAKTIKIVGTAGTADQGKALIEKEKPDLIFLDINMPGKSGFDLMAELDEAPYVIFVTAYDQYAIKAFEINALDYLLKPVNAQRLEEAVERVHRLIDSQAEEAAALGTPPATVPGSQEKLTLQKHIFVKDGDRCFFLKVADIECIESVGNYAKLHFNGQSPLLHRSLNYLEEKLPSPAFFRANRQQIIHTAFIKSVSPYFSNTLLIELKNGTKIEVSQRQTARFKEENGL